MTLLDRIHSRVAGATAYTDGDQSLTYGDLAARISTVAAEVRRITLPGAVVMARLPNSVDFAPAVLGVLTAGRSVLAVSAESPPAEVAAVSSRVGPSHCFAPTTRHPEPVHLERLGPVSPKLQVAHSHDLLLLSSGSTGRPKIVRRSVASLDAVARQMVDAIGITSADVILATVPLCHSYGIEHGLLAPLWAGAEVRLCRGLELGRVESELMIGGATILPAVPSAFEMLGRHLTARPPGLRLAYSAGGHLPTAVAAAFTAATGVPVGQIYGATEIGSVTFTPTADGTAGRPMAGVKIKWSDGRVLVRADSMFHGYVDDPSPVIDGYYPTGDLGRMTDAGDLIVTGRATLLIDVGGLKVDPLEVERVIASHPAVAECVVVPVRQSETVVRLKAVIVSRGADPSVDDLRRFVRERLSGHKVPRVFEFRTHLPRSPSGKFARHLIDP